MLLVPRAECTQTIARWLRFRDRKRFWWSQNMFVFWGNRYIVHARGNQGHILLQPWFRGKFQAWWEKKNIQHSCTWYKLLSVNSIHFYPSWVLLSKNACPLHCHKPWGLIASSLRGFLIADLSVSYWLHFHCGSHWTHVFSCLLSLSLGPLFSSGLDICIWFPGSPWWKKFSGSIAVEMRKRQQRQLEHILLK